MRERFEAQSDIVRYLRLSQLLWEFWGSINYCERFKTQSIFVRGLMLSHLRVRGLRLSHLRVRVLRFSQLRLRCFRLSQLCMRGLTKLITYKGVTLSQLRTIGVTSITCWRFDSQSNWRCDSQSNKSFRFYCQSVTCERYDLVNRKRGILISINHVWDMWFSQSQVWGVLLVNHVSEVLQSVSQEREVLQSVSQEREVLHSVSKSVKF